jgi:hypothetical protein
LDEIYHEGDHDFLYVSYVYSKNKHAYDRMKNGFNFLGTPTVWFDGGMEVVLGGYSGCKQDYIDAINSCCVYDVHDLKLDIEVHWLGNATMDITVRIENIDSSPSDYGGYLKVYVTEIESTLGWNDTTGKPYKFAFLDYAFNETVSIDAGGGVWEQSTTWDGHLHNNGYGVDYGSITHDNIAVLAVVYNDEWHQGYSYPPDKNPFDAYYVDEAEAATPDTLWADADTIPEAGGTVNMSLSADEDNGGRNYLIVGGTSGTEPGYTLPGGRVTLPINWDWFSDLEMTLLNSSIFSDFMGTLDGDGKASAQLNVPTLPAGSAGLIMYYAYCCNSPFDFASNAVAIEVVD